VTAAFLCAPHVRAAALACAAVLVAGCQTIETYIPVVQQLGVYKIDINQGNYLSQDMVDRLQVGMTRQQVRATLGTPLVTSAFRDSRWDYVYEFTRQGRLREHRQFTVYFAEEKLSRWEGDEMPQSVVELNRSAASKALPSEAPGEKSFWDRVLDVFRK